MAPPPPVAHHAGMGTDSQPIAALLEPEPHPAGGRAGRRVLAVAERPETTIAELVAELERDDSVSAEVLSAAGAARGPHRRVSSLHDAVALLGREGVRRVVAEGMAREGPPVAEGAGSVLRAVLDAHVRELSVAGRARDAAEGARAAVALDRALEAICEDEDAIALMLRHALSPRLLAHGLESAALACVTACRLGWSDAELDQLAVAGLFADVGMTRLDADVWAKPGALTAAERERLELHPALGAEVLAAIAGDWPVAEPVALEHHERWDGAGYPAGLSGPAIRREAQVVAVCHRYLAAVSCRPHRPAMPPHEALDLLYTLGGRLADPAVVRTFTEAVAAYPLGALVRLSDGRCGRVVEGGMPTRPRVEVLWEPGGEPSRPPCVVALSECQTLFVASVSLRWP